VDLAGAEYPKKIGDVAITPLEGRSLVPAFADKPIERDAIFWEHERNRAVRVGDWKLVSKHSGPWELYDISKDRVEGNDVASANPERVKALTDKYDAWAKRARVEPWPVEPAKKKNAKE
jgi:arylsulfatase A-like enzyme